VVSQVLGQRLISLTVEIGRDGRLSWQCGVITRRLTIRLGRHRIRRDRSADADLTGHLELGIGRGVTPAVIFTIAGRFTAVEGAENRRSSWEERLSEQ
jgi:hypothetical protein